MDTPDSMYTVRDVARLAKVSVRTLHHYDEIGLLHPRRRSESGYRLYGREELLRLQQILFYRELDLPLAEIRAVLNDPQFDTLQALESHRRALTARSRRLDELIETVEKTIRTIKGEGTMLTDNELYRGFSPEEIERYQSEAKARWPAEYDAVDQKLRALSKDRWDAIHDEGGAIAREAAALIDEDPTSPAFQRVVERHHRWIEHFYGADATHYIGLAEMYVADERFAAHYNRYALGLADALAAGMRHYAETRLV